MKLHTYLTLGIFEDWYYYGIIPIYKDFGWYYFVHGINNLELLSSDRYTLIGDLK